MGLVRVAIADDDAPIRRALRRVLERSGFEVVVTASDGNELLSGLVGHPVDGIITDFHMDSGGLPLLDTLRQTRPGVPVYVFSGGLRDPSVVTSAGARRLYVKNGLMVEMIREIYEELA